jgi:hypothetical protein
VTRLPGRPRNGAIAAIVVMGLANYAALTWPGLRVPLLEWRAPFALVLERPWHAWLRSTTPVPVAGWPMREIVHALSASAAATKARLVPGLLAEPAPEDAAPEALVRTAYRRLLRREPDPVGLETYSRELRAGTRSAAGLLQELASSDEFRERPLRVLVVPDHPFLNSSTLRYYAEAARAPVVFDRVEPGQPPPSLRDWDALVVKEGGYPGPAFSTTYVAWIEERLRESGAGLALLPPPLPCPDGSSVRLFAAAGASGP